MGADTREDIRQPVVDRRCGRVRLIKQAGGSQVFLQVTQDLLNRGYRVRFRAEGISMVPTIRSGEAITVEPVLPGALKVGDIALYRTPRGVIAHRVRVAPTFSLMYAPPATPPDIDGARLKSNGCATPVAASQGLAPVTPGPSPPRGRGESINDGGPGPRFIMRGDAASSADEPVEWQQILGKVVAVERRGRSLNLTNWRARIKFFMSTYASGLKGLIRGACPGATARFARLLSLLLVFAVGFTGTAMKLQ